ncbi:MAG: SIS domain-containing protein, partial [Parvularculaceae bacterium]
MTDKKIASHLANARDVIGVERDGLNRLQEALSDAASGPLAAAFVASVELIATLNGRVIVTGMGKSGHIARKIAATLASTGQPAMYVHPGEASHGDLGMI